MRNSDAELESVFSQAAQLNQVRTKCQQLHLCTSHLNVDYQCLLRILKLIFQSPPHGTFYHPWGSEHSHRNDK